MTTFIKLFCALLLITSISACQTMPAKPQPINKPLSTESRAQQLSKINHWVLKGAVAVRNDKDAWSASLNWQRRGSSYSIQLFGPMGAGKIKISGRPGKVTLTTSDKKTYTAATPEALFVQQTGWNVPISNLNYWIKGMAVPGIPSTHVKRDRYGHLRALQQQGWNIRYIRYTAVNGIDLPSKLSLQQGNVRIRIIISHWQL